MEGRFWPWKRWIIPLLMATIVLFPLGYYLKQNPDFYECPKCGRKRGSFWM